MNVKKRFFGLPLLLLLSPLLALADGPENKPPMKAAVLVANRAEAVHDDKIRILEDLLSSRLSDLGFSLISREVAVDAMRAFDPETASLPRPEDGLAARLTDQTSALRLAQNMGADYIVMASLINYGHQTRNVRAYGTETVNTDVTARVSYRIIGAADGGSMTGDTVNVSKRLQATANVGYEASGVEMDLLDDASQRITESLATRVAAKKILPPEELAGFVKVNIQVEVADLYVPDVRLGPGNTVAVYESKVRMAPFNVSVEVDGVTVGTAPGEIEVRPGFSSLRLTRNGFKTWERTINARDGQVLTVAMEMTDEGLQRWAELTAFMNALENGARLTDAQVKVMEGQAKMLEQSGYRVDIREDSKVDIRADSKVDIKEDSKVDIKVDTDENFKFIIPGSYREI